MRESRAWFVAELERLAGHGPLPTAPVDAGDSYASGGRPFYRLSVPERRALAKAWLRAASPSADLVVDTADALITDGTSFEEKTLGPMLLAYHPPARRSVAPEQVEGWLGGLVGWAEIDGLCQSVFTADDLLARWGEWKAMLLRLSVSPDVSRRRGSLVLLTGPVASNDDERLERLAFTVVDRVMADRDPLITKAVSWLLRALAKRHADAVADYLRQHEHALPAIAVRETRTKLRTGTKTGRRR